MEVRSTPRAIHRLSVRTALATLHLRQASGIGFSQRSHPWLLRLVVNLRLGADARQQAERMGRARFLRNGIAGIGQVAEANCASGAGFDTRRKIIGGIDFPLSRGCSLFL